MKKIHSFKKTLTLFLFFFLIFGCGGVYAMFQYPEGPTPEQVVEIDKNLANFNYLFPDTPEGKKNEALVGSILNGTEDNPDIGLNNPSSRINTVINNRSGTIWGNRNVLGNMDGHERDALAGFFTEDTENMSFLIYFPDGVSDTYYLFTTTVDLGSDGDNPNIKYGEYISPIYRTVLKKNSDGEYEAVEVGVGEAASSKYQNYLGSLISTSPSFDVTTWRKIDS